MDPPAKRHRGGLTREQEEIISRVERGESLFFCGVAGTGKSTVITRLAELLDPETTQVTAMTGIAAVKVGGGTFHGFMGVGNTSLLRTKDEYMKKMRMALPRLRRTQTLIVDEVSMLDRGLFEMIDGCLRLLLRSDTPFGGIQLVLVGDFSQLPPVKGDYCFESPVWQAMFPPESRIELTEVFRQSDPSFIEALRDARGGSVSDGTCRFFRGLDRPLKHPPWIVPTKIYCCNKNVDDENSAMLARIAGTEETYESQDAVMKKNKPVPVFDTVYKKMIDAMDKSCLAQRRLVLKVGAQVMLLRNIPGSGLANGSQGEVESLGILGVGVKFESGVTQQICPVEFKLVNGDLEVLRTQIPLKLSWAITVHKSQGMGFDWCEVDLSRVFACGQAYTALSRARSPDRIRVVGFDRRKIKTSEKVARFYRELGSNMASGGSP